MRTYPLSANKSNGVEVGDSAGRLLKGLSQNRHVNHLTLQDTIDELASLQIVGTAAQLSRCVRAELRLTLPAELRLLEICGFDSIEELCEPSYDDAMA